MAVEKYWLRNVTLMAVHVLVPVSGSLSLRMVPQTQICASWWLLSWGFAHSLGLVCAKVLQ